MGGTPSGGETPGSCHTQPCPQDPAQGSKPSTKSRKYHSRLLHSSPRGGDPSLSPSLPLPASPQVNNLACLSPAPGWLPGPGSLIACGCASVCTSPCRKLLRSAGPTPGRQTRRLPPARCPRAPSAAAATARVPAAPSAGEWWGGGGEAGR